MLYPVGFKPEDFIKPMIGIASAWSMVTPCNMHLDQLAREAEAGANAAGGKAIVHDMVIVEGIKEGRLDQCGASVRARYQTSPGPGVGDTQAHNDHSRRQARRRIRRMRRARMAAGSQAWPESALVQRDEIVYDL
jgi:hypothetical protein